MRTHNCLLPKVHFLAVFRLAAFGLALIVGQITATFAQEGGGVVPASYQSGSFFNQQLGTALRFNYHTRGYGTQDDVFSLGGMKVFNMGDATLFVDGQGTLSEDFGGGYNLGVGYRQLTNSTSPIMSIDPERILGVGFWTDGQSTSADNFFTQLGFSLESLGESFDLRLNGQFPLESTQSSDPTLLTFDSPMFVGNNLVNETSSRLIDTAHSVIDGEFAKRIRDLEAWAFVGGYQIGGGGVDTTGYRAGVRGYAVPDVALSLQVTDDSLYATNVMFGITWFIGRTHRGNGPCGTIIDRFREPVLRNDFIATTQRSDVANGDALTDQTTGDVLRFVHVDSDAVGGDGTFENPLNSLAGAAANSLSDDTILLHAGSTLSGQYTAKNGQRILGEGGGIQHTVSTREVGVINLPETSTGALNGTVPTILGSNDVFTLLNDNELNNFSINSGARAIVANGVNAPEMRNLDITGITGDGITLANITGISVIDSTVVINNAGGIALLVDGGSDEANLAPAITNVAGQSVVVRNRLAGHLALDGTVNDTGLGILVEDNMGGEIHFTTTLTLSTDANDAVVTQNNTGAMVIFDDLNATTTLGNSLVIEGGGTVNVNNAASMLTNTGTGDALVIRGDNFAGATGDATVTIAAAINNSGGGRSVDIQDRTANDVILSGAVTDTDEGVLVQNNSAGSILFTGAMTLNTGANDAVRLASNMGADISFTGGLDIDTLGGAGFFADGGGTISAIGTNTINTTTGVGLDVRNVTIGAADLRFDSVTVTNGATNGINLEMVEGIDDGSGNGTSSEVIVGSGVNPGDGGTLTVAGTAIRINQTDQATLSNVTVNNTANGSDGVILTNSAGDMLFFSGLNITTENIGFSSVGGGELSVTATNNITTTSGTALLIDGNVIDIAGVTFDSVSTTAGTNTAIDLEDLTGGAVTVGRDNGIVGDGGTILTSGTAISVSNVRDAVFNDVVATSSGSDAVVVNTTAGFGRADLTLSNNRFTATGADDSAFLANLAGAPGDDVRFLFNEANVFTNTSNTVATLDIQATTGLDLNATIVNNTFINNGTGDDFSITSANSTTTVNLHLDNNTADGGAGEFLLNNPAPSTAGNAPTNFNIQSRDDVAARNTGTVIFNSATDVIGDFGTIPGPVLQP